MSVVGYRILLEDKKERKSKMDKVRLDELIAQTPEQTLADYARIDAIIAKGTVTTRKV